MSNQLINFLQRFGDCKIPEHIEKPVYESNKYSNIKAYLNSKYATREYANRIKNDPDEGHLYYGSRFATDEELSDLLKSNLHDKYYSIYAAMQNPNLKKEHLDLMLNSDNGSAKTLAVVHKNLTTEQLDRALNDSEVYVRKFAATNQTIKKYQLLKALNDPTSYVVDAAKTNPKYREYFPNGHESEIK